MSLRVPAIPDRVWELHKRTIEALYSENTLNAVAQQMREKYDFDATEKQYKRRFEKWKIGKYIKKHEVQLLLNDPASPRTIRGKQVSDIKIKRHCRRHWKNQAQPETLCTNQGTGYRCGMCQQQYETMSGVEKNSTHCVPCTERLKRLHVVDYVAKNNTASPIYPPGDICVDGEASNTAKSRQPLWNDCEVRSVLSTGQDVGNVWKQNRLSQLVHALLLHKMLLLKRVRPALELRDVSNNP